MKKAKLFGSLTLLSGVALTLAACGNNSNSKVDTTQLRVLKKLLLRRPLRRAVL